MQFRWQWALMGLFTLCLVWPPSSYGDQLPGPDSTPSPQAPIVQGLRLGSSRADVETLFAAASIPQIARTAEMIVYQQPVSKAGAGDFAYSTALLFHKDKLAKVALFPDISEADASEPDAQPYFSYYGALKSMLIKQYGPPRNTWEHLHKRYRDHPLLGLQMGRCTYANFWSLQDLDIALVLTGENFSIQFSLQYEYRTVFQRYVKQHENPTSPQSD